MGGSNLIKVVLKSRGFFFLADSSIGSGRDLKCEGNLSLKWEEGQVAKT